MAFADILYSKIINYQDELDRTPLVTPETWSGGGMIVTSGVQTLFEETVSEDSGLGQAVNAATNFEINPAVVCEGEKIIFVDELIRNIGELNADVFGMIERSCEIEVFDIETSEFCTGTRENAVDLKLECFEGACVGANIARIDDTIAANGDASAIFFLFVWLDFANHFSVCDLFASFRWNVFVSDDMKGFCACDALLGASGILADALAETSKFVCIRAVPGVFVFGMTAEGAMLERQAGGGVEDGEGPSIDEGAGEATIGGRAWSKHGGCDMDLVNAGASAMCNRRRRGWRRGYFGRPMGTSAMSNGLVNGLSDRLYDGLLNRRRMHWGHPWSWHRRRNMDGC